MSQSALIPPRMRLRSAHALDDHTGAYPLIYDLERGLLIEVPDEFVYHIRDVLETGELEETVLGWLASVDVLTWEPASPEPRAAGTTAWAPGDADGGAGGSGLGGVFWAAGAVHCHPGAGEPSDELLRFPFGVTPRGPVIFHLTLGDGGAAPLRRVLAAAREHERTSGREVAFEVETDAWRLDRDTVELLGRDGFRVRLSCPPAGPAGPAGRWTRGLARRLGSRLTLAARFGRDDRLTDLWRWAAEAAIERLDGTRDGGRTAFDSGAHAAEEHDYRQDLAEVCEEMYESLVRERSQPLLFEPVARVVRRMISGPAAGAAEGGCLALVRDGELKAFPSALPLGSGSHAAELDRAGSLALEACSSCWARQLCSRSVFVRSDPPARGEEPLEDRCDFWREEATAALFFYRRLQQADPDGFLGFPADARRPAETARPPAAEAPPRWVF